MPRPDEIIKDYVEMDKVYHEILAHPIDPELNLYIENVKNVKIDFNGELFNVKFDNKVSFEGEYLLAIYTKYTKSKPTALMLWKKYYDSRVILVIGMAYYSKRSGQMDYNGTIIMERESIFPSDIYVTVFEIEEAYENISENIVGIEYDLESGKILKIYRAKKRESRE